MAKILLLVTSSPRVGWYYVFIMVMRILFSKGVSKNVRTGSSSTDIVAEAAVVGNVTVDDIDNGIMWSVVFFLVLNPNDRLIGNMTYVRCIYPFHNKLGKTGD